MRQVVDATLAVTETLGTSGTAAALAGLVVLILLLVTLVGVRRRRREAEATVPPVTLTQPAVSPIHRPVYVDPLLLDDLLAHAEDRDHGRALREVLGDDPVATAETRKLNKVLAGLDHRRMLVDLDDQVDAPIANGSAVRITGRLEELPASKVAELLELSTPVLVRSANAKTNGDGDGGWTRKLPQAPWGTGPRVLALTPRDGGRRYLLVLHPDGARDETRRPLVGDDVTVLGVVEQVLGRRDSIDVDDYLTPYLSRDVQARVRDTDLVDAAEAVASLAGRKIGRKDLTFEGPGAHVSVAAVYR